MVYVFPLTPHLRGLYLRSPIEGVLARPGDRTKAIDVDMAHRNINRAKSAAFSPSVCLPTETPFLPRGRSNSARPQLQPKAPTPDGTLSSPVGMEKNLSQYRKFHGWEIADGFATPLTIPLFLTHVK